MTHAKLWLMLLLGSFLASLTGEGKNMEVISVEKVSGGAHYRNTLKLTYRSFYDGAQDWALLEKSAGENGKIWVIVLHGHGSSGNQLFTREDIATTWLAAIRERGLSILSPNLRGNAWMCRAAAEDLNSLIQHVRWKYDAAKFIIVSGSMGGTAALIFAVNYPWQICGVCALCPATDIGRYWKFCRENKHDLPVVKAIGDAIETAYGGSPETAPASYMANSALARAARLTMPVYLSHGDNDALIPVEESRSLAAELEKNGNKYVYAELKGGHHDSPIAEAAKGLDWIMKANPALAVVDQPAVDVAADSNSAVYRCGEKAAIKFTLHQNAAGPESGTGLATIALDSGKIITTTNISWTSGVPVEVSGTLAEPGFLRFAVKFNLAGGKVVSAFRVAGFDPEQIKPASECPDDFRSFWAEGKKQFGTPEVKLEKIDKFTGPRMSTYLLSFPTLNGKNMYGFLVIPNKAGKYPAIARVCDGGVGAAAPWVSRPDAIGLTLLVHDFPPAFDHAEMVKRYQDYNQAHGDPGWHLKHGVPDREKYYYRDVILGADYAINYLATRPEWDGKHLVINGSSQGGMFSLYMAGLNTNLTATIATVPYFCDLMQGPFPKQLYLEPKAASVAMFKYYDAVNFARLVRCPILFGIGFLDSTCNPGGIYAAYNVIQSPKKIINCPLDGHGQLSQEYREYTERWLDGQLGISAPLPPVGP